MIGRLQKFDYRRSAYVRPNQKWVCGWTSDGRPCQIGPDEKGHCRATFECRPVRTAQGRWQCTRSELAGGRCEDGPLPDGACCLGVQRCRPVRSIQSRRAVTVRSVAALTFACLLILVAGSMAPGFLNPGPVTFQHGEVFPCSGCHTAFEKGRTAWLHAAFGESTGIADSERCLACHDLGSGGLRAHSVAPAELAELGRNAAPASAATLTPVMPTLASFVLRSSGREGSAFACMTCHREHHGQDFDLTAMSNRRCTTCHTTRFDSLSKGHPDFSRYPYGRRTRIMFDHASHIGKHFRKSDMKEKAPRECKDCHAPDTGGRTMVVRGFEASCGACHAAEIAGKGRATAPGLPVFTVPGLDVDTLAEVGAAIGGWPDFPDAEITPFMEFLMAGDPDYAAARRTLAGLDLLDLAEAEDAQIAAVERFAWSVKELYFDLTTRGMAALKARLQRALGRELEMQELAALAALLPADAVRAFQSAWFPDLLDEVARRRAGEAVPMGAPAAGAEEEASDDAEAAAEQDEDDDILADDDDTLADDEDLDDEDEKGEETAKEEMVAQEDWAMAGGWYRDDFTLRYRPGAHADGFLRAWLDVAARATAAPGAAGRIFDQMAASDSPGLCARCHSVDADANGAMVVNWRGRRPLPNRKSFTTFVHTAHFSLLDNRGCLTCHRLDRDADYASGFKDRDPDTFASNFKTMERGVCAGCHTEAEAGDGCLVCHNYHVGTFAPTVASSPEMSKVMDE